MSACNCLQTHPDGNYYRFKDCDHPESPCALFPCNNVVVCGEWIGTTAWHNRCLTCDMKLNKDLLVSKGKIECDHCKAMARAVQLPFCEHRLCICCFRELFLGKAREMQPKPVIYKSDDFNICDLYNFDPEEEDPDYIQEEDTDDDEMEEGEEEEKEIEVKVCNPCPFCN